MKIEKGKRYRCVSSYPLFSEGTIYPCHEEGILVDDDGDRRGVDFRSINSWFELVQEPSTEDLLKRIEALEKQMQPCPTAEKFKEIADHANAINEVIQNAPKEEVIYVPDGILDIEGDVVNGDRVLHYYMGGWNVNVVNKLSTHRQFKLEPCKREDLKVGDVAFRTSFNKPTFDNLSKYCIVLEDGCQYWNKRECQFDDMSYNHLYKVVEA
jgi:hypothetical protein